MCGKIRSVILVFFSILAAVSAQADIDNFEVVDPGKLYRGARPESRKDFALLREHGIKTLLDLETVPGHFIPEKIRAQLGNFRIVLNPFIPAPIGFEFLMPQQVVTSAFQAMIAPENQPVYVHCKLGQDRTGLMVGLYQVHVLNLPPEDAYSQMLKYHFKQRFFPGIKKLFWENVRDPELLKFQPNTHSNL